MFMKQIEHCDLFKKQMEQCDLFEKQTEQCDLVWSKTIFRSASLVYVSYALSQPYAIQLL